MVGGALEGPWSVGCKSMCISEKGRDCSGERYDKRHNEGRRSNSLAGAEDAGVKSRTI